jgi:hypothetical protein
MLYTCVVIFSLELKYIPLASNSHIPDMYLL